MTFSWGTITKVHKIEGMPDITEYVVGPEWDDKGKTNFHVETEKAGTVSFDTLDQAIMGLLCDKYDDMDVAGYVWRLLNAGTTEEDTTWESPHG